jgi:hypothetical protein
VAAIFYRFLAWLSLLLACAGCGDVVRTAPADVVDSGYWSTNVALDKNIFWLDEDRVMFAGFVPRSDEQRNVEMQVLSKGIFIWDTHAGTTVRYADIYGYLCHSGGYVSYLSRLTDRHVVFMDGPLGHEKETQSPGAAQERALLSPLTCKIPSGPRPALALGHAPFALLDGHGFLDLQDRYGRAPEDMNKPVLLYRPDGGAPVELPVTRIEVDANRIRYFEFADSYLLWGARPAGAAPGKLKPWPEGMPHPVYLMTPAGEVTTIEIPYAKWMAAGEFDVVPTKAGLFVVSHNMLDAGRAGGAAGYMLSNNTLTAVLPGYIEFMAVSPGGCKIAFARRAGTDYFNRPGQEPRIQMLDVCKAGRS